MEYKKFSVPEELISFAIGSAVIRYFWKEETIEKYLSEVEPKAVQILEEIRKSLNDESLDDPTCFQHIEAIVNIFMENCIDTNRHDW